LIEFQLNDDGSLRGLADLNAIIEEFDRLKDRLGLRMKRSQRKQESEHRPNENLFRMIHVTPLLKVRLQFRDDAPGAQKVIRVAHLP
jgi:hypothetical protein